MNLKDKLFLDAAVASLLILCIEYDATGPFIHELIGVILIAGLITHVIINLKYYRILRSGKIKNLNIKNKISLILNILLPVSLITMAASSAVISKDIFSFLNIDTSHYEFWRLLHIISACTMLVTAFAHTLMHLKMFSSLAKKKFGEKYSKNTFRAASCAAAVIAGVFVVKSSSHYISENFIEPSSDENNETYSSEPALTQKREENIPEYVVTTVPEIRDSSDDKTPETIKEIITEAPEEEQIISEADSDDDKPTLEDYLRGLTCNGCGKHCSLLAPRCGKGKMLAQSATEEYNNFY